MPDRLAWLQPDKPLGARRWLMAGTLLLPLLFSCQGRSAIQGSGPCRDGSQRCAAAAAPAGSRAFFRGSRPLDTVLVPRRNRESGAADFGGRSRWQSFSETR